MLICPSCKKEYREGFKICSDCQCELTEIPDVIKKSNPINIGAITTFIIGISIIIIGILLIISSPHHSYKFTSRYFFPNGNGACDPKDFMWMLNAYHYSFLLAGSIICLSGIIYWIKNMKNK